jgi:Tol biopolymer transport system component
MAYPPIFNLRAVSRDGTAEHQITFGDVSYVEPDMTVAGKLFASRVRMQSDIWRFPVTGSPADNVKNATRITQQTGQVQAPSVGPDGSEVTYLSDNGGHANVWVATLDGSAARQITFERDPAVGIGVPIWSPVGDRIVFIRNPAGNGEEVLINSDGSGQRGLVTGGAAAAWSRDGKWLYYMRVGPNETAESCIDKVPVEGGPAVRVRCEGGGMAISSDGSTLYYAPDDGRRGEIRKATPDNGPSQLFARFALSRVPLWPNGFTLSPDDRWLAALYKDAGTTNIWAFPADGAPIRQLTDFGHRPVLIARRVSWAPDSRSIFASVVETDADVVLLDGMLH